MRWCGAAAAGSSSADAGCDPKCAYEDLANAARKIYIDLGVSIDFEAMDLAARQFPPKVAAYCALGSITNPGSNDGGWLLCIVHGYHGNEPVHIQGYANAYETFRTDPQRISFLRNRSSRRIAAGGATSLS
jgi:hypothetical protein